MPPLRLENRQQKTGHGPALSALPHAPMPPLMLLFNITACFAAHFAAHVTSDEWLVSVR